jgi:aminoglycoside phosphotransferase (APT) family kinase protein
MVAAFLDEIRAQGFSGVPRVIAADDAGQFVVEYIEGEVLGPPPYRLGEARARSAARLIRAFHDASEGTGLAGGYEIVMHGDLGPHNLVFRGEEAVAIIDWDEQVGPGTRANDLAHAIWCCADLLDDEIPGPEQRLLLEAMCNEYGGIPAHVVLDELAARFERAIAQHHAAHRPEAAVIFAVMADRLREARPQLLGG